MSGPEISYSIHRSKFPVVDLDDDSVATVERLFKEGEMSVSRLHDFAEDMNPVFRVGHDFIGRHFIGIDFSTPQKLAMSEGITLLEAAVPLLSGGSVVGVSEGVAQKAAQLVLDDIGYKKAELAITLSDFQDGMSETAGLLERESRKALGDDLARYAVLGAATQWRIATTAVDHQVARDVADALTDDNIDTARRNLRKGNP